MKNILHNRKVINIWYVVQLMIYIFMSWIVNIQVKAFPNIILLVISLLCVLGVFTILPIKNNRYKWLLSINNYFQMAFQTLFLINLIRITSSLLVHKIQVGLTIWIGILSIFFVITFIPFSIIVLGNIQSLIGRIVALGFVELCLVTSPFVIHSQSINSFVKIILNSGLSNITCFVITCLLSMYTWGFELPRFRKTSSLQWPVIIFLILFATIDCIFNAFNNANNWSEVFTAFDWHISFTQSHLKNALVGIQPGIMEEFLFRYCCLTLILYSLRTKSYQIELAVFLSSLIFGSFHLVNLTGGQSLMATLFQVLFATCMGILYGAVYLYTNNLLCPIVYHGIFDSLVFFTSGTGNISTPNSFGWQIELIIGFLYIGIAFFLLSGKRLAIVKQNLT